jgi:hypothetical protein
VLILTLISQLCRPRRRNAPGQATRYHWRAAVPTTPIRNSSTTARLGSVIYCVGYTRGPLPTIVTADCTAACVTGCEPTTGALLASGVPLPGLYGAGIAFAAEEGSSGAPYPEASLKAFTARASAIAADVGRLED